MEVLPMSVTRILSVIFSSLLIFLIIGCSAGNNPVIPDDNLTDPDHSHIADSFNNNVLWGYYSVSINADTLMADVIPLRGASFTANVTRFMQPPMSPTNMVSFTVDIADSDPGTGFFAVDVTLRHPFPGLYYYNGFDVRGIMMAYGSVTGDHDSSVFMTGDGDTVLTNADGYTRFWNWTEFTSYETIFGACHGKLSPPNQPDSTINPYKYFSDSLSSMEPVEGASSEERGFFTSGSANTRRYDIQFKMDGDKPEFDFNYAIDASWSDPDPEFDPVYPVEAFPLSANCAEAYHMVAGDNGSDAWYIDETDNGGTFRFSLEVFDHQAAVNPSGVEGEISAIWIEGETLPSPINVLPSANVLPGSHFDSAFFEFELGTLDLTHSGVTSFLVTIESADPTSYAPQLDGGELFDYPDALLSAYFTFNTIIPDIQPDLLTVISPNGGEEWGISSSHEISWNPGDVIGTVYIEYSKDYFVSDINTIVLDEANDGSYMWGPIPDDPSDTVRVRITSTDTPSKCDVSDDDFTITDLVPPTTPVMINPDVDTFGCQFAIAENGVIHTAYIDTDKHNVYWSYSDDLGNTWTNVDDPIYTVDLGATPERIMVYDGLSMDANGQYVYLLISEWDNQNTSQYCKLTGARLDTTDVNSGWDMFTVWMSPYNGDGRNNFGRPAISVKDDGSILVTALYYYGYGGYFSPSYSYATNWAALENITRLTFNITNGSFTYIYPDCTVCLINDGTDFFYATGGLINDSAGYGYGKLNAILKYTVGAGNWQFVQSWALPNQSNTYQRRWRRGLDIDDDSNIHWALGYTYNNTGDMNYGSNYGDWCIGYASGDSSGDHDFSYQCPITETYHHRSLASPGYYDACYDYEFNYSSIGVDNATDLLYIVYQSAAHDRIIYGICYDGSTWSDPVEVEGDSHYGQIPFARMHDLTGYMFITFTDADYPSGGTGKPHFVAWK